MFEFRNSELVLHLTEPVFRQVVRINLGLRGLAFQDAFVCVVFCHSGKPVCAVWTYLKIRTLLVGDEPVPGGTLDNLASGLVMPELCDRVFKIVPGFHRKGFILCRVKTEFPSPQLIRCLPRVQPDNRCHFAASDACLAVLEPFLTALGPYNYVAHIALLF